MCNSRNCFGVTADAIEQGRTGPAWRALMRFEVERARALMLEGAPLATRLPGRIGLEESAGHAYSGACFSLSPATVRSTMSSVSRTERPFSSAAFFTSS